MLSKETLTKIASTLKLKVEDLETAIKSETEVSVDIPTLTVLTADELTARDENIGRTKYNEGKTAGVEMGVKELKNELGLEFDGKDIKSLVNAVQTKTLADAKVEPNKKVEELNMVVANLQKTIAEKETEKSTILNQLQTTTLNTKILGLLPQNRSSVLNDDEYMTLVKKVYEFAEEEGKLVVKKDGNIVRNATTQSPLEPKEVLDSFFTERKFIEQKQGNQGGQGGGNSGGNAGVFTKLSELEQKFVKDGKSLQGTEFASAVAEARKANPQFDLTA